MKSGIKRDLYIPYKIFRDIHDTLSFLKRKQSQPYVQYNFILEKKNKIQLYNFYMYSYEARKSVYSNLFQRGEVKRNLGRDD